MSVNEMKAKHKLLKEYSYKLGKIDKGYANRTLYVNLSENEIKEKPVTQLMKDKFIGGKGFGLKLLWDATKPNTNWDDPENEIIISPGPVAGITQYAGAGKSLVVSISPLTNIVIDSNVGGYFGPFLKFAGFDALEVQGKAKEDVIVVIDGRNGTIRIEEAPTEAIDSHILAEQLTDMYAESEAKKNLISVVSAGMAAENSQIGVLNFSFYDKKRKKVRLKQAGRGGIGSVLRNKKIKALVAIATKIESDPNNVVDMKAIQECGTRFNKEMRELDDDQCRMRKEGTAHLVEIMNDYDLLPTKNFKYGSHKDIMNIHSSVWRSKFTQNIFDGCWIGCTMACAKAVDDFELQTGHYKGDKVIVDGPEYETVGGLGSNCEIFDADHIIEANFYCDTYGIDTISFGTLTAFLMECYENGIIDKEKTGGLDLSFGNKDAVMELMHQMARGEGFGLIAGLGIRKIKKYFVENFGADEKFLNDIGMENKGLEYSQYVSKESLAQQGGYAMTNKGPQHDEAWLIFMDMVNNQIPTFEDKAEALHYFPMFRTWFGLMGLCKLPWNDVEPADNAETDEPAKVPEHVQNYLTVFGAVTGIKIDKEEMIRQSERVYNFQRVFNIRRGYGLRKHDAQPYRAAGPVTMEEYESRADRYDKQLIEKFNENIEGKSSIEKVAILRKHKEGMYEQLLDSVYYRRGWNKNGVPKIEHLKDLGMDLPEVLEVVSPLQ
ncbi:MAG: aldehyde:ferredoxin oxidoreductase [Candidatus Cloacimonetes bacterium]|jgi:aldehyde:ferredoxin oxidoreductase|nr:aldehyde:ferredoxin oxidoreductase [Candidatus Cloacimonadota bacterium]MBT6993665.1 aldehyde:ferredoxin oxidoreductase [Candidatus Cloacimonadota bacterium]MBT7468933.1 aldehyde:ferredoxin oxidoreductase [Candidatus Cloacimonadota bacterium]